MALSLTAPCKIEAITEGEDLAAAKSQSAAMTKAKADLKSAAEKAAAQTAGSRAISVTPDLEGGRAATAVALLDGDRFKMVEPIIGLTLICCG